LEIVARRRLVIKRKGSEKGELFPFTLDRKASKIYSLNYCTWTLLQDNYSKGKLGVPCAFVVHWVLVV